MGLPALSSEDRQLAGGRREAKLNRHEQRQQEVVQAALDEAADADEEAERAKRASNNPRGMPKPDLVKKAKLGELRRRGQTMNLRGPVETHALYIPPPLVKIDFKEMVHSHDLSYVQTRRSVAKMDRANHQRYVHQREVAVEREMEAQHIIDRMKRANTLGSFVLKHQVERMNERTRLKVDIERCAQVDEYRKKQTQIQVGMTEEEEALAAAEALQRESQREEEAEEEASSTEVLFTLRKLFTQGDYDAQQKGWDQLPQKSINTLTLQLGTLRSINMPRNNLEHIISLNTSALSCTHLRHVTDLNFSCNKLRELPAGFGELVCLTSLNVENNRLSTLPASMLSLGKVLKVLNLRGNNFAELPYRFGDLKSLEWLDLAMNILKTLPSTFVLLTQLKYLNLESNGLAHLDIPPALRTDDGRDGAANWKRRYIRERKAEMWVNDVTGQTSDVDPTQPPAIKHPGKLKEGTVLYNVRRKALAEAGVYEWEAMMDPSTGGVMYRNNVNGVKQRSTPPCVDQFGCLAALTTLKISHNKMQALPDSISQCQWMEVLECKDNVLASLPTGLGGMQRLRRLRLDQNNLTRLPSSLGQCGLLEELSVTSNVFSVFPDFIQALTSLRRLGLGNNNLKKLPYAVGFLTQLTDLELYNNPLKGFPPEILMQGMDSILWECRQRYWAIQRGAPPEMKVHGYGIQNEKLQLYPEFQRKISASVKAAKNTGSFVEMMVGLAFLPLGLYDEDTAPELLTIVVDSNDLSAAPVEFEREWEDWKEGVLVEHSVTFSRLARLSMRSCKIKELHPSLGRLVKLSVLRLEANKIKYLPDSIARLRLLTRLDMRKNRLLVVPDCISALTLLKKLELDGNRLEMLPDSICTLPALEVLTFSSNSVYTLPNDLPKMQRLRVLDMSCNDITLLPHGMGAMTLKALKFSFNRIEILEDDVFRPNLTKSLRKLWMASNNLLELPHSFTALSRFEDVKIENNPFISPPSQLLSEGMAVVVQYIRVRRERIDRMLACIKQRGFDTSREKLVPEARHVVRKKTGYLKPDDLQAFDKAVDRYLNAEYYKYSMPVDTLVDALLRLREDRQYEFFHIIVDAVMRKVEGREGDTKSFTPNVFKRGETRPWGRDGEPMKVNIISCDALFKDCMPNAFLWDPRRSVWSEALESLPPSMFQYSKAVLTKALNSMQSPYGPVAEFSDQTYPSCECVDHKTGEELRHGVGQCCLKSLTLVHIIYTEAEAMRRAAEEEEMFMRFDEIDEEVNTAFHSKEGTVLATDELKRRKAKYGVRIQTLEVKLAELKATRSGKVELHNFAKQRQKQFELGEPFHMHKIKDVAHSLDVGAKAARAVETVDKKIADALAKRSSLQQKASNTPKQQLFAEALDDLVAKYSLDAFHEVQKNHRIKAIKYGWRRPWDGLDGEDFSLWAERAGFVPARRRERPQNVGLYMFVRDPDEEDPNSWAVPRPPLLKYDWADTEDMSRYETPLFTKWLKAKKKRKKAKAKAAREEMRARGEEVDTESDSSDSDDNSDADNDDSDTDGSDADVESEALQDADSLATAGAKKGRGGRGGGDDDDDDSIDDLAAEQARLDALTKLDEEEERREKEAEAERMKEEAWAMQPKDRLLYNKSFTKLDKDLSKSVDFSECEPMFRKAGLSESAILQLFGLSLSLNGTPQPDKVESDAAAIRHGALSQSQFAVCFHMLRCVTQRGMVLPTELPVPLRLVD